MKLVLFAFSAFLALATAQFNLTQFLNTEGINPNSIVTSNCTPNGFPCSPSGGSPCCLSPVFVCQPSPSGQNTCSVVPGHRVHIPIIRQIMQSFGVTTQKPIY